MSERPYKIESPTLLPNGEKYDGEKTYTREDLKAKDYEELRQMAATVDDDAVNGKSTKMEIISFFTNVKQLDEF